MDSSITVDFHRHELWNRVPNYLWKNWFCRICLDKFNDNKSWNCQLCQFDICEECAKGIPNVLTSKTAKHEHPISYHLIDKWECSSCQYRSQGTVWNCVRCNFYLCTNCKVLSDLATAIESEPSNYLHYMKRGNILQMRTKYADALPDFTKVIELLPNKPLGYEIRGKLYDRQKLHEEAYKDFSKWVELDSSNFDAWAFRGHSLFLQKKYKEALADFSKSIELEPKSAFVYNFRASTYNYLSEYANAIQDATIALSLDPYYSFPYGHRALAHLKLGNLRDAEKDSLKCLEIEDSNARAHYIQGCVLEQKQEFERAIEEFKLCLALLPEEPMIIEHSQRLLDELQQKGKRHLSTLFVTQKPKEFSKFLWLLRNKKCRQVSLIMIIVERMQNKDRSDVPQAKYHCFLSHYQRTGGLLAMVLKLLLEMSDPSLRIFLDVDDLEDIHDLKKNVENSENIILLLTEGVFERRFVLEELTTALSLKKNIIVIWDKERCSFPPAESVPEAVKDILLLKFIVWNAEKQFRNVVIQQLLQKMVITPSSLSPLRLSDKHATGKVLYVESENGDCVIQLKEDLTLQQLIAKISTTLNITRRFWKLQYYDKDFNKYVDLHDPSDLSNKTTVRVASSKEILVKLNSLSMPLKVHDGIDTITAFKAMINGVFNIKHDNYNLYYYHKDFDEYVELTRMEKLPAKTSVVLKEFKQDLHDRALLVKHHNQSTLLKVRPNLSLEELKKSIKEHLSLTDTPFSLQYFDKDFGEYVDLHDMADLPMKTTVKLV